MMLKFLLDVLVVLAATVTTTFAEQVSVQAYVDNFASLNTRYNSAKITAGYSNCFLPIGARIFILNTCNSGTLTTWGYYDITGDFGYERPEGYRQTPVVRVCNPPMSRDQFNAASSTAACPINYVGKNSVVPLQQTFAVYSGQVLVPAPTPQVASGQVEPAFLPFFATTPNGQSFQVIPVGTPEIASGQITEPAQVTPPAPSPTPWWPSFFTPSVVVQPTLGQQASTPIGAGQLVTPTAPAPAPYFSFWNTPVNPPLASTTIRPLASTTIVQPPTNSRCVVPGGCFPGGTASGSIIRNNHRGERGEGMGMRRSRGRSSVTQMEALASGSTSQTGIYAVAMLLCWQLFL